jgi:hypothetical protein
MEVYFEIKGQLVEVSALELYLGGGSPLALLARRKAEPILRHPELICPQHQQPAAAVLRLSAGQFFDLDVEACCAPFRAQTRDRLARLTTTAAIAAHPFEGSRLLVHIDGHSQPFTFHLGPVDLEHVDRLVIGRYDPDTGHTPEIDLSPYNAYERGVSRRHASLVVWNRDLYLIDEGSPNGTFLNDQRLTPQEAHLLKFGDHVRMGRLKLAISLHQSSAQQRPV